jgi:hypothetical protein
MIRLENNPNQCDESAQGIVRAIALFYAFSTKAENVQIAPHHPLPL